MTPADKESLSSILVITFLYTGPCSAVGSKSDNRSGGRKFVPGLLPYFCGD